MKLVTKSLEKKFEKTPLYSQDGKGENAKVLAKFFTPWANWTWYVLEAEKQENGDYLFFGYVQGYEGEYGYFALSQLAEISGPFGLKIERDMYFDTCTLKEAIA